MRRIEGRGLSILSWKYGKTKTCSFMNVRKALSLNYERLAFPSSEETASNISHVKDERRMSI